MTLGTGFMIVATTMPMNMMLEKMSLGMIETVKIFVLTLLFSLPFGLVVAWGRMSRIKIVKWLVNIYISIMRGTPLMLQVMAIYFGPSYILKIQISRDYRFYAVIISFVLNYAAYFAEIYRSGIESMPRGQYEAANMLGMNHNTVRKGLQQGVFPWGYGIRTSENRWVYFIYAKRFAEIEGIAF